MPQLPLVLNLNFGLHKIDFFYKYSVKI